MKALIIYDATGRIWGIIYGEETAPQGLTCMYADIPYGAQLEKIDVSNPDDPKPVYTYLPDSDIGRLQKKYQAMEEALFELKVENEELTLVMADMIGGAYSA